LQIENKTVLLTGATGGLGRAIAEALATKGAKLVLSSRKADELDALRGSLPGGGHRVVVADLALHGAAQRLLEEAGEIDILVANAALPAAGPLPSFSQEEIERALRVNFESPVRMARELVPAMTERKQGHLLFVSSLSGRAATAGQALYSGTKFALRGFAFALRDDLRGSGVGVSIVSPGTIRDAGMWADTGHKPLPGMGTSTPGKVANGVVSAIERDRGEVLVAPFRQRLASRFAANAPEISGRLTGKQAVRISGEVAAAQTDKR
jgi:short-subunit dehydrogenase